VCAARLDGSAAPSIVPAPRVGRRGRRRGRRHDVRAVEPRV